MLTTSGLRALLAIVDLGTFGGAAAALGYAQSTISQQVRILERDAGGPIFDRSSGPSRSQLTSLGRLMEHHARLVVHELDAAERAAMDHRDGRGRLTIGTFQAVTTKLLPALIRALAEKNPHAAITMVETETPLPDLDTNDLCFFDSPPQPPDHGELIVADEHLLLAPRGVVPPGAVELHNLRDRPMVALPAICDQGRVELALTDAGVTLDIVFRTTDNHAITAMVEAGAGCAILPALSISPSAAISIHRIHPPLPYREIWVQWRGSLSPLAQHALKLAVLARPNLAAAAIEF
ncbi:LysR family transcriptional regulator [Cryobacterium luteum]|uniref:LysR family transcriptional regulator n=1 Tax=Cryobacterium luteum TaxID=1424661 RepID=A0A1H8LRQ9_9MICO|nr:LysR family transcriptional regulator [Cryobacterium luteum]TFB82418.1 LysR family transcriptional regulator [Cryobacterium luteum]SEO07784.1 DNA-binding transcriptional regulator, LysR family [Cryobacterium luteum]